MSFIPVVQHINTNKVGKFQVSTPPPPRIIALLNTNKTTIKSDIFRKWQQNLIEMLEKCGN